MIGVRLSCEEVEVTVGALKAFWKRDEIKPAPIIKTKPIKEFLIVFFASSIESGFPTEVIYIYPPRIKNKTEAREAIIKRVDSV